MQNQFFLVDTTGSIPEILVYGYIGLGDELVNAADFVKQLRALEAVHDKINVRINSAGGSIFEGIAIYSAMKNSRAEVNTIIDGLAASMGSVIALGGSKVKMSNMARIMTHKASGFAGGSANNMRQTAALLESLEDTMAAIYASKTGLSKEDAKLKFLGDSDLWMTAQDALDAKLIDEVFTGAQVSVPASAKTEQEVWNAFSASFQFKNENHFMKQFTLSAEQLSSLSLTAGADQAAIQTAIENAIAAAAKLPVLQQQLDTAVTEKTAAENALNDFKVATETKEVEGILATGLAAGKFSKAASEVLKKQFAGNVAGLKELVGTMQAYKGVVEQIDQSENATELAALLAKDYPTLDKEGKLQRLKELSDTEFKAKFKKHFGIEYGK